MGTEDAEEQEDSRALACPVCGHEWFVERSVVRIDAGVTVALGKAYPVTLDRTVEVECDRCRHRMLAGDWPLRVAR